MIQPPRSEEWLVKLVEELCKLPAETAWLEFKQNQSKPDEIGEYIAALANAAALEGKSHAYMVWGVEDGSHDIVGTTFKPHEQKKGNEELIAWLRRMLTPRLHFDFHTVQIGEHLLVVLEIPHAHTQPATFSGKEFIRIGSNKKPLKDYPDTERLLWQTFSKTPYEELLAAHDLDGSQVLALLDYPAYFDLQQLTIPGR